MSLNQSIKSVIGLIVSLAVCFMVGCTSSGRSYTSSGLNETLEIQILPNTSKMFIYRLKMPDDKIPSHIRIAQSSRDNVAQAGINLGSGSYRSLLTNVEYVVKKTGYCREGFLEIDKSLSRYHIWMKGECKEGATGEDQQKFGSKQTLTPESWK